MVPITQKRIFAFLIDYLIFTVVFVLFIIIISEQSGWWDAGFNTQQQYFNYSIWVGMIFFCFKDCFKGRSIGKRIIGLEVVSKKVRNQPPPIHMLFLRNITIILWVIELPILLMKQQRLGDMLARTKVV